MIVTSTWPDTGSGELIGGGRYRLGPVIGSGGMSTVHRAHDLVLDRDVAVKIFRDDVASAGDTRRVEAEMKLLGSISHPGLVTLHDASVSDDGATAFLVMELVDGDHLARILEDGPLPSEDAARVVSQVAAALAHIHARGIVHRDVKPANILIRRDADGRISAKLADLGIARVADATRITTAGTVLGTVAYLSPEQVSGAGVGAAADVYSLGLVLLESLTGRRPFPGTPAESAARRTVGDPEIPPSLDADFALLVRAMTRRDPGERISADEVASTLRGGLEDAMTRALPLGAPVHDPLATAPLDSTGAATGDVSTGAAATASTDAAAAVAAHTAPAGIAATDDARTDATPTDRTERMSAEPTGSGASVATDAVPHPVTASTETTTTSEVAPRRRVWFTLGIVLAVLLAAAVVLVWLLPGAAPGSGGPDYPEVPGELGELLRDLQESVQP